MGPPVNPKPPPRPPPPGPASAPVIAGIVRSKVAPVTMPLIKRALAGMAVFNVAARGSAGTGCSFVFKLRAPCADMSKTLKWRMVLPPQAQQFLSQHKPQRVLRQKEGKKSVV